MVKNDTTVVSTNRSVIDFNAQVRKTDTTCFRHRKKSVPPAIAHADVETKYIYNKYRRLWVVIANYTCHEGYQLAPNGSRYLFCQNYDWVSPVTPVCEKSTFDLPLHTSNSNINLQPGSLYQFSEIKANNLSYGPAKCGCPILIGLSGCPSVRLIWKKWLSPFYSTYECYIHQTCTNCASWHVLYLHFTLEWPCMVRKKWLSPYYSTYWCSFHQTCTICSSWHDLLIPRGGLCPWQTFHAWVTMVRKKCLSLYYSTYWCYIHQTYTNCSSWHDLLIPVVVCVLDLHFTLEWPWLGRNC